MLPKLVYGESVRHAGILVESGNTDAGLIALTIARNMDLEGLELPQELYDPIQHVAAIHRDTPVREQAEQFLEFLTSPEAKVVYDAAGLMVIEE